MICMRSASMSVLVRKFHSGHISWKVPKQYILTPEMRSLQSNFSWSQGKREFRCVTHGYITSLPANELPPLVRQDLELHGQLIMCVELCDVVAPHDVTWATFMPNRACISFLPSLVICWHQLSSFIPFFISLLPTLPPHISSSSLPIHAYLTHSTLTSTTPHYSLPSTIPTVKDIGGNPWLPATPCNHSKVTEYRGQII